MGAPVENTGTSTAAVWVRSAQEIPTPRDNPARAVAHGIFTTRDLASFHQLLIQQGFTTNEHRMLLFNNPAEPGFAFFVDGLVTGLRDPRTISEDVDERVAMTSARFPLALLMNYIYPGHLSREARTELNTPDVRAPFSLARDTDHIVTGEGDPSAQQRLLILPPTAESTLHTALTTGAAVLVNKVMVVPMFGPIAGLCTQTFTAPDGSVFIEGNWYAPVDGTTNRIVEEFDKGVTEVDLTQGKWQLLRGVTDYDTEWAEPIKEFQENPGFHVTTMSPSAYREKHSQSLQTN